MDCREVLGCAHAYLDGELDEEERIGMSTHLRSCEGCRRRVELERSLRDKVRLSLADGQPTAPATLRARVRQALTRAERQRAGPRGACAG